MKNLPNWLKNSKTITRRSTIKKIEAVKFNKVAGLIGWTHNTHTGSALYRASIAVRPSTF